MKNNIFKTAAGSKQYSWKMYASVSVLALLLIIVFFAFVGINKQNIAAPIIKEDNKNILVISSYMLNDARTSDVLLALDKEVERLPWNIHFNRVAMDYLSNQDDTYWQMLFERHIGDIKNGKYDAAVLLDDPAVRLILRNADKIPQDFPFIFAGYESYQPVIKQKFPNITGVRQIFDLPSTIEVGRKLWPSCNEVIIFCDDVPSGHVLEENLRKHLHSTADFKITIVGEAQTNTQDFLSLIEAKTSKSFLILTDWRNQDVADYQSLTSFSVDIARKLDKPFLSCEEGVFNYGALGGFMTDTQDMACKITDLMGTVLSKGSAVGVPIVDGTVKPMFDIRLMKSKHLDMSALPKNTDFVNEPQSIVQANKKITWLAIGLFTLFVATLIVCLTSLGYYKRGFLQATSILEKFPLEVGIVDSNGTIHFYSNNEPGAVVPENPKNLREFAGLDYDHVMGIHSRILETRKGATYEYSYQNRGRVLFAAPIDLPSFGSDTVMWISYLSEAQAARKELEETNNLFSCMLENIPCFAFVKDMDKGGRYILVSSFVEKLLGLAKGEALNKTDSELFGEEFAAIVAKSDKDALENCESNEYYAALPSKDGYLYVTSKKIALKMGERQLIIGVGLDMSELNNARKSQANSERIWHILTDSVSYQLMVKDYDDNGKIILCNEAVCRFFGKTYEDLLNKPLSQAIQTYENYNDALSFDNITADGREIQEYDESFSDVNGVMHHFRSSKRLFTDSDGRRFILVSKYDYTPMWLLMQYEKIINDTLKSVALESDLDKNINTLFDTLATCLSCSGSCIVPYYHSSEQYSVNSNWMRSPKGRLDKLSVEEQNSLLSPMHPSFVLSRSVLCSDTSKDAKLKGWYDLGVTSLMVTPVFVHQHLWGVLCVGFDDTKHEFSDIEEYLMTSLASITALAVIRKEQMESITQSDHEKQLILDNIIVPVWLFGPTGKLIRLNQAADSLLPKPGELQKLLAFENDGEYATSEPIVMDSVLDVVNTKIAVSNSNTYNGRRYLVRVNPLFDSNGEVTNVVKSAVDVTDVELLEANERAINELRVLMLSNDNLDQTAPKLLRNLCIHLGADNVYFSRYNLDDGRVELLNAYHNSFAPNDVNTFLSLHISKDDGWYKQLEQNQSLFFDRKYLKTKNHPIWDKWDAFLSTSKVQYLSLRAVNHGGKLWGGVLVTYHSDGHQNNNHNDSVIMTVAHLIEIMLERKISNRKLLNAMREAQEANKTKTNFLSNMSHEVRTPLNTVITMSDCLRLGNLDTKEAKESLKNISSAGVDLLAFFDDVLELSGNEFNLRVTRLEEIDPVHLFKKICASYERKAIQKGIALEVAVSPMPVLMLDQRCMRQIVVNLLGNAIQFTDSGYVKVSVSFTKHPTQTKGVLKIIIEDTGVGVSEEHAVKIFEPFNKIGNDEYAPNSGTGLGLAVAKKIVDILRGNIEFTSQVNKGSTFVVTLPDVPYSLKKNDKIVYKAPSFDTLNVLLLEDMTVSFTSIYAQLKKLCKNVTLVGSGAEAEKILSEEKIDIFMTDVFMEEMDGDILAGRLKKKYPDLPIVALLTDSNKHKDFDARDFVRIILKPCGDYQLSELVDTVF